MNRRQFLNAFGLGLIALSIPRIAKAQAVNGKRIITLADPAGKHIKLMKDGHQIGLVYWVNLDTGEYRRVPASTGGQACGWTSWTGPGTGAGSCGIPPRRARRSFTSGHSARPCARRIGILRTRGRLS